MANDIELAEIFARKVVEIYKLESKTVGLDALTQAIVGFEETATVSVMKVETTGLGNYDRIDGYPSGDVTAEWVPMTLSIERARAFVLDRMDNVESLGLILGNMIRMWMREKVAPEIDAIRFAKYATGAGLYVASPATLTSGTIVAALDVASLAMNEAEVPEDSRKLFMSFTIKQFLEQAIGRELANETRVSRKVEVYNDMEVIGIPQSRFYKAVALDPGAESDEGGFTKDGHDINFMILHPSAVLQPTKLNQVKYFNPDINQLTDGHLWQYRLYHDAFVVENAENGIYLHDKGT